MAKDKTKGLAKPYAADSDARIKLPAFSPDWARQHLKLHHGIKVAKDISPVLAASIHQADHMAAGIGGRPLVVAHYHTAEHWKGDE